MKKYMGIDETYNQNNMVNHIFSNTKVQTTRLIHTPSQFARANLYHLQETGTLTAVTPHISKRESLQSYLFFIITNGSGTVTYNGKSYDLHTGDCFFIDCRLPYSQCSNEDLWSLKWVHFYGNNMAPIYEKYQERGGLPVFTATDSERYITLLDAIYSIAASDSYIRDMELSEKLTNLLTYLMSETIHKYLSDKSSSKTLKMDLTDIKSFIDQHFTEKIILSDLEERFFINKHYLNRVFKQKFGTTVNNYILNLRITAAKNMLRFSEKSIEAVALECGFDDANYFTRAFKKIEGVTPTDYRKSW